VSVNDWHNDPVLRRVRDQGDLITRAQALSSGMTESALQARIRPGGRWKVVLPGVYLAHDGRLAGAQREIAAILYAGDGSVISGQTALVRHGVRVPVPDVVDVLIPHDRRRQSTEFVQIHRTLRMPERPWASDGLLWAPVARAVADAVRGEPDLRQVRATVAAAVQQGRCTVGQLAAELRDGPMRGSAALRTVIKEVAAGAASGVEIDFQRLIKASGLPEPVYNASLYVGGEFLARPDAWWKDAGVAGEVDSREWHLSPADWQRTTARHAKMSANGIIVLHFTPQTIRTRPAEVMAQLKSALELGQARPPLNLRTVPRR
jgi:hypothetical protein